MFEVMEGGEGRAHVLLAIPSEEKRLGMSMLMKMRRRGVLCRIFVVVGMAMADFLVV